MRADETYIELSLMQGKKVGNGGYHIRGRVCMELLRTCLCFEIVIGTHRVRQEVVVAKV